MQYCHTENSENSIYELYLLLHRHLIVPVIFKKWRIIILMLRTLTIYGLNVCVWVRKGLNYHVHVISAVDKHGMRTCKPVRMAAVCVSHAQVPPI